MANIKYEGPTKLNPFKCSSCSKTSKNKYLRRPHAAIAHLLNDNRWVPICAVCARREIGSKNVKGWRKLNGET